MPSAQKAAAWLPRGIVLEEAALRAVKTMRSTLVVAGPGAGKTELLAQRACYLLQTGFCPAPFRILAISFKRDAAANLRDRVLARCGREYTTRFDSLTFDAFGKDLVDRFRLALPPDYRPTADYRVLTTEFTDKLIWEAVQALPDARCPLTGPQRHALRWDAATRGLVSQPLPIANWDLGRPELTAGAGLWMHWLHDHEQSALGFPMIGRLADFLLRQNPTLVSALRSTYRFVFLDEFQDTTRIQYALALTAFRGSPAVLTAVGDNKQRIMKWAGAFGNIFQQFVADFEADTERLTQNHRSVSRLVGIQQFFAQALDPDAAQVVSARPEPPDAGECRAFQFANEQAEAEHLAGLIQSWIRDEGLAPRDICILCRMKTAAYTAALIERLAATDIAARIEDNFQRVLSEDICAALVDVFTLATQCSAPLAWERTLGFLSFLSGGYDPTDAHNLASRLLDFTDDLAGHLTDAVTGEEEIQALLLDALSFFGRSKVCAALPQYGQGSFLDDLLGDLTDFLVEARSRFAWPEAVAAVIGAGSVPIMTTHKSKGLEFHTMVFIGLEDDALFNFAKDPEEETCGIFVALSRAKQRAFFTFSSQRTVGRYATKSRRAIDGLYDLFAQAGIVVEVVP
jgi:DNA helicase-2/ATP-dependent DNA helicase PcrA